MLGDNPFENEPDSTSLFRSLTNRSLKKQIVTVQSEMVQDVESARNAVSTFCLFFYFLYSYSTIRYFMYKKEKKSGEFFDLFPCDLIEI